MEPRTHYQISLTARQAVGIFVGLLLALGLAFFFGLMTGLSGRERRHEPAEPSESASLPSSDVLPPVETGVPVARGAASKGTREQDNASKGTHGGEVAALATPAGGPAMEPTPPTTLQTFEDAGAEEPTPGAAAGIQAAPKAAAASPGAPAAPSGRVWVQVASVSAKAEADAMASRLSKRGYHTAVAADAKGRLRVRVGPYRTTEDARRAAERLRKQEKIKSPWVVFEGK